MTTVTAECDGTIVAIPDVAVVEIGSMCGGPSHYPLLWEVSTSVVY